MIVLGEYMQDGADKQSHAVMALLQDNNTNFDLDKLYIGRWDNCREQGYVVSLSLIKLNSSKQLNIAFFQHRNSDNICAVKWEQITTNTPTIESSLPYMGKYAEDKYAVSYCVEYGEILPMAEWIKNEFQIFWDINN